MQWRYYGPFCARQSFKGLFWQNGPVFGPFLPPESSFSLNLCKQCQHHLPWWLQHPHSQASLSQSWRQFINLNRLLFVWGWGDDESAGLPWWQTDELKTNTKYVSQSGQQIAINDLQILVTQVSDFVCFFFLFDMLVRIYFSCILCKCSI